MNNLDVYFREIKEKNSLLLKVGYSKITQKEDEVIGFFPAHRENKLIEAVQKTFKLLKAPLMVVLKNDNNPIWYYRDSAGKIKKIEASDFGQDEYSPNYKVISTILQAQHPHLFFIELDKTVPTLHKSFLNNLFKK